MKRLMLCALILGLVLLGGCSRRDAERVPDFAFRYAENQADDFPTTQAAYFFADRVAELSQGRIRIYVYADAELGDERSVIEQMQYGGIDFGRINLSPLSEYDNRLFTLQLPYLYDDSAHMWRVLDGEIGDAYLASLQDIGLIGLTWVDAGVRHFYTHSQVRTLADMKGLDIRVQENSLMERMMELLGAEPIKMRYSEVLPALQTGKIDGAENNYPSYQSTGHYMVAKYVLEDEHTRIPEVIVASPAAMNKLDEAGKALIVQAAQEAGLYQRTLWQEYEQSTRQEVIDSGCEIYIMPAEEKESFRQTTQPIYDEFAADAADVIAGIRALREE